MVRRAERHHLSQHVDRPARRRSPIQDARSNEHNLRDLLTERRTAKRNTVVVRRATPQDAPTLAALRYEFRAEEHGTPSEDRSAFIARCERWFTVHLLSGAAHSWVAERRVGSSSEVLGTGSLLVVEKIPSPTSALDRHVYLSNVFVRAPARNMGVGSALLDAITSEACLLGFDMLLLRPTPRNRMLYERFGFRGGALLSRSVAP